MRAICSLFSASEAVAVGRIIAVVGAKGGVGASTVAHNVAWAIARDLALDSVVIDLDLAFGTASLDYNQDPVQGIANAVFQPERPDTAFMERLLAKCTDRLSLLAAPATLDQVYDFGADAFDAIFDTMRMTTPCIVLDVPHQWSAWTKRALVGADDILIVAEPDLANMRNAKNMLNVLKAARPNDRPPLYCLNQVGMHKRPEITTREFAKAIESQPIAAIPFDSRMFGTAANNGQMIAQISAKHRTTTMFLQMAQRLTGHAVTKQPRTSFLAPIIKKLQGATARRAVSATTDAVFGSDAIGTESDAFLRDRQSRASGAPRSASSRPRPARSLFLPRQQPLQLRDIGGRLLGRQVGLRDLFGLGDAALQANHQRQIGPHARIGRRTAVGAAQRLLGLGQIFRKHVGQSEIGQHRRLVGRDLQRARIILPRLLIPAELVERRSLRREHPPIRIVGAVGAAEHVEGLLEIAVVRQRAAVAGEQRLVAGMGDRGLFEHRNRLGLLSWRRAAPCRIAAPRRHPSGWRDSAPGRARRRAADRRRGSVSAFSPSEPVMSDSPEVWQLQSPNARISGRACTQEAAQGGTDGATSGACSWTRGGRLSRNTHSLTLSSG